jgi:hypothetical protein
MIKTIFAYFIILSAAIWLARGASDFLIASANL